MPEVLLVQPPIRDFYLTAKRTLPYGLAAIATALKKNGISVEIFDALAVSKSRILPWPPEFENLSPFYGTPDISPFALFHHFRQYGYSFEHFCKVVKEKSPFLVGISSLFTPYAQEALDAAVAVKQIDPKIITVLGGHHPTACPETVMKCADIDFVVRGEGETVLPALISALRTNSSFENVPGLVFRDNTGKLRIGDPAFLKSLDDYPVETRHRIDHRYYRRKGMVGTVVVASRGCPLRCSYCCVGNGPVPYRKKSVSTVIREIESAIMDHQGAFIDFEDENLAYDRKWFLRLLQSIVERFKGKSLELRAMNGLMPVTLDDKVIEMMKTAGFRTLNLSLGSTHEHRLKAFTRPDVRYGLDIALRSAKVHGMDAVTYIIIAALEQNAEESLDDLIAMVSKPTLVGLSVFYPAPGSPDYDSCRKRGLLPPRFSMYRSSAFPIEDAASRLEIATLLRLARMVNFLKGLVKECEILPGPKRFNPEKTQITKDRKKLGLLLISWFLSDGDIRGVTPDGRIYSHTVSPQLTQRFREAILKIPIRI